LLSFVESAPRAYWLKASNAAPSFSTFPGTIPPVAPLAYPFSSDTPFEFHCYDVKNSPGLRKRVCPAPPGIGLARYHLVAIDKQDELILLRPQYAARCATRLREACAAGANRARRDSENESQVCTNRA
jgi:hypothetical protein